jgi:hypothetical protein
MDIKQVETQMLIIELANRGFNVNLLFDRESVMMALIDENGDMPSLTAQEQTELLGNAIDFIMDEIDSMVNDAIVEQFEIMSTDDN